MNQKAKSCPAANNLLINDFFPSHPLGPKLIPGTGPPCIASAGSPAAATSSSSAPSAGTRANGQTLLARHCRGLKGAPRAPLVQSLSSEQYCVQHQKLSSPFYAARIKSFKLRRASHPLAAPGELC